MGVLHDKMLNKMKIKGFSENTQKLYLDRVKDFVMFHNASPDKLETEDIFAYQVYLVEQKQVSYSVFNISVCALRFFYNHVLNRDWFIKHIPFQKKEKNYLLS
jgi:hypothetical protein